MDTSRASKSNDLRGRTMSISSSTADKVNTAEEPEHLTRHSSTHFSTDTFQANPIPTVIFDNRRKITGWNAACENLTGINAVDVLGILPDEVDPELINCEFLKALFEPFDQQTPQPSAQSRQEWFMFPNGQKRHLLIQTNQLSAFGGASPAYLKTIIDLTGILNSCMRPPAERDIPAKLADPRILVDRIDDSLARSRRSGEGLAVYWIEIYPGKENLTKSAKTKAQDLLQDLYDKLRFEIRAVDTLTCCDNLQFVIVAAGFKHQDHIADLAYRLLLSLSTPLTRQNVSTSISYNIGVSVFPEDGADSQQLLDAASLACKKQTPFAPLHFHSAKLENHYAQSLNMQAQLSTAVDNEELRLDFQPKASLHSGKISGMEVLLRWKNKVLGNVSPADFIPVAERLGLINELGKWVIRSTCLQYKKWHEDGLAIPPIAINLSGSQLKDSGFSAFVRKTLTETGVPAEYIEFEITETTIINEMEISLKTLHELKNLGLTISLDDFGTGYSSLSYLRQLPIDKIKIDRSFINDVTHDPSSAEIVRATIGIARALGLKVIAEGVENQEQMFFLKRLGCDEIQGYFFARPDSAEVTRKTLPDKPSLPFDTHYHQEKRILVVDDEPAILNCIKRELGAVGYEVEVADSARQGLALLARKSFALVISDYLMPGINGACFLEKVKQLHPQTVRIAMSGSYDIEMLADYINRGEIFKFVFKPWSRQEILKVVEDSFMYQQCRSKEPCDRLHE